MTYPGADGQIQIDLAEHIPTGATHVFLSFVEGNVEKFSFGMPPEEALVFAQELVKRANEAIGERS